MSLQRRRQVDTSTCVCECFEAACTVEQLKEFEASLQRMMKGDMTLVDSLGRYCSTLLA